MCGGGQAIETPASIKLIILKNRPVDFLRILVG